MPESTISRAQAKARKLVDVAGLTRHGMPATKVGANFSSIPQTGKLKALIWTATPALGTRMWLPTNPPLRPSGTTGPSCTTLPDGRSEAPVAA